jgi:hypothetical protein
MTGEMPVPTDWTEEDGYRIGILFFPDSPQWLFNVHGALYTLTRGRAYDFDTGYFKGIEAEAEKVWESFMSGNLLEITSRMDEFTKTQRMIVAALMGQSINFDSEELPNAINYENGIRQAILSIGASFSPELTLGEVIALMEDADGPEYGFKDYLEILRLLQEIFTGASLVPIAAIGGLLTFIFAARTQHNTLALQAMQATALRGIQNAIAPPKDPVTEEATVQSWADTIEKIPFLTTAIVALVDPSPAGEGTLAVKIALSLKNLLTSAYGWLSDWWNVYVNTVDNPQPQGTVVGMLSEISRKVQSLADEQSTPTVTVSNRLKAISDAIEGIEVQGVDLTPTLVEIAAQLNDIALPDGVTWAGLFAELSTSMEESVPVINVTCSSCGSSSGCGCGGGGSSGAYGPGVGGPADNPPASVPGGTFPTGFPDLPAYSDYKCKAANTLVLNLAEMLAQMSEIKDVDLSQYESWQSTREWIYLEVRIAAGPFGSPSGKAEGWIADRIMEFAYPYPNDESPNLAIFSDIRLDYLTDQQDAVCELFQAGSTSDARTAIEGRIDGYIDATAYSSDVKSTAKEMYKAILSNSWLGRLFEKDSFIVTASSSGFMDCDLCSVGCDLVIPMMNGDQPTGTVIAGSLTSGSITIASNTIDWGGNPASPTEIVSVLGSECCVLITSISSTHGNMIWWAESDLAGCGDDVPYFESGLPPEDTCFNQLYLRREDGFVNTPFEITLTWVACP